MLDISIPAISQQLSCKVLNFSMGANSFGMDGLEHDTRLINDLCNWARVKPSRMATDLGMAATTLARPASGKATTRLGRSTLDALRKAYPDYPGWSSIEAAPDVPDTLKSEEGSIPLRHLDLSLSMGDGTKLEDHYEEGVFEFDAALLRTISRAPSDRLVVGQGIGDSMLPTLHDRDMIIFDTTQTALTGTDRIWAISIFGAGGVKRLRPVARGRVLVISDNPALENYEVDAEDLRILGRVIWSARRH